MIVFFHYGFPGKYTLSVILSDKNGCNTIKTGITIRHCYGSIMRIHYYTPVTHRYRPYHYSGNEVIIYVSDRLLQSYPRTW